MPPVLRAQCPTCRRPLRIPAEWVDRPLRCKFCRATVQTRPAPGATPLPLALAVPTVVPTARDATPLPVPVPTASAPAGPPPPTIFADAATGTAWHNGTVPMTAASDHDAPLIESPLRRSSGGGMRTLAVAILVLVGLGAAGAAGAYFLFPQFSHSPKPGGPTALASAHSTGPGPPPTPTERPVVAGPFPRRLLAVSVNQYLYANPTNYGADPPNDPRPVKHGINFVVELLAGQLRIPKEEVFQLGDAAPGAMARPTLKPVIEETIARFLATSRAQDRIVLLLVCHATEIDDQPYLVPLEGDLAAKETLIPLQWVYDRLKECKAQQKCLIVDFARYDPARGSERPGSAPLGAKIDEALKNPPPGVQVWTSCVAGQRSYESDYEDLAEEGVPITVKGGLFLNLFFHAASKGNSAGIQRPTDPIRLTALAERVNILTEKAGKTLKAPQTARLVGAEPPTTVPYDPKEALAARFELPKVVDLMKGQAADRKQIRTLLNEIDIPPVKIARAAEMPLELENVLPFPVEVMKKYASDGLTSIEIQKEPAKYPIRVATLKAIELLHELRTDKKQEMPEELRGSASDAVKKDFFNKQRVIAGAMFKIDEARKNLEVALAKRDAEKSARWLAHADFTLAALKARLAYTHEYDLMFAKIRADALPPLDEKAGHKGWRLASEVKLQSTGEFKEYAEEARELFAKVAADYKGTPWEVLAKRERLTALGLRWQPTNFGE